MIRTFRIDRFAYCFRLWILLALFSGMLVTSPPAGQASAPPPTPPPAPPNSPAQALTTPDQFLYPIYDFTIHGYKVFYDTLSYCPIFKPNSDQPTTVDGNSEVISRTATYGDIPRRLYYHPVPFSYNACIDDATLRSNIIADDNFIYWTDQHGLVKLSTSANVGDPYTTLTTAFGSYATLTQDANNVYAIVTNANNVSTIWQASKAGGSAAVIDTVSGAATSIQTDGQYVFWLINGTLRRYTLASGALDTITTGVSGYFDEGKRFFCPRGVCFYTDTVYIAKNTQIFYYRNDTGAFSAPIYTSSDPSAVVYDVIISGLYMYFFESRALPCNPNCNYVDLLQRTGNGGGLVDTLYSSPQVPFRLLDYKLTYANQDLFWQEYGQVLRLPANASALPLTNMRVTGIEVTQSVQDWNNSVRLIQDKRTFVRAYVQSDGPAVFGVTAYLYASWAGGTRHGGPLVPVNPVGQMITVQPNPDRNNINASVLFEIPWEWTFTNDLTLQVVLNPNHNPPQASYANNIYTSAPFAFQRSPRLPLVLVDFLYTIGDTTYGPRVVKDVLQTYSWLRRAYPLASPFGLIDDPSPGLRTDLDFVIDDGLGSRVDMTNSDCNGVGNLCASAYAISRIKSLGITDGNSSNTVYYGMITDAAGYFPRGQDGGRIAAGPAGSGTWGWDNDGSYADWYAGHEIGHALGRSHPTASAMACGNSASDNNYPYTNGHIGPDSGALEGFDVGDPDPLLKLPLAVYPGTSWNDVMSYCNNQWISDYTYNGMYDYMINHPSAPQAAAPALANGDYLVIAGDIVPDKGVANIQYLRRQSSVASIPPITPGDYSIRMLDAHGATLADDAFTPEELDGGQPPVLSFAQAVSFAGGTAKIEIVHRADNKVLASASVPAHGPVLSGVSLGGAPQPVSGNLTLTWTASHPDGLPLTFDVRYSRDGGASFKTLQVNLKGGSAVIDTTKLSGSTQAVLQVVASDGVNTASADSPVFSLANKPPQVHILLPGDGTHIHYGQLVNFSGGAEDLQDGTIPDAKLAWSTQKGPLGTGRELTRTDLPVGDNLVTLTATDSNGLSASATVHVIVDDDLTPPGPALAAAPTQLGWHVAAGTTKAQTAQVTVSNSGGGGELAWTASSDQPWLKVSATSGNTPTVLTLTADPTLVPAGESRLAHLTITAGGASQTILVSLSVGDVWGNFPRTSTRLFLPFVNR